jgi:uncharacterized membrane protein YgcG
MGLWSALQGAMRTRRNRRIGLAEADRLVAGQPPGPDHRGLSVLLGAATAPPSAEELAGERAAVARFVAANRGPAPLPTSSRVRAPRSARTVAIKLAAGVAVLATGGTAVAAETGKLPAGVQQRAHQLFSALGVPAPVGGPHPTATATGAGPTRSGGSVSPAPTRTPPRSGATTQSAEPSALGLCRSWDDARSNPRGKAMPAASRHALAAAAGGEAQIADFCASLLFASPSTPAATPPSTTSQPSTGVSSAASNSSGGGNGEGNGVGNGNGGGNGNGVAGGHGEPHPTPVPSNPGLR